MRFFGIKNLRICLLLCLGASPSEIKSHEIPLPVDHVKDLFPKNGTLVGTKSAENLFGKFFLQFAKATLRVIHPRHVTIIGASPSNLQDIQFAFGNDHPFIIHTEIKEYFNSIELNSGNLMIILFDHKSLETFEEYVDILLGCKSCRIRFVFIGNIRVDEIWMIFYLCNQRNVLNVAFVHFHEDDHADIYGYYKTKNCSMEIAVTTLWKPDIGFSGLDRRAVGLADLNGCTVNVSFLTYQPEMKIKEIGNGSFSIMGGSEGNLLLTLAKKLNFTLELKYPIAIDSVNSSRKMSVVNEVAFGKAEFGIGQLRPTNSLHQLVMLSIRYDDDCVTWGVPHIMTWHNNVLGVEFSWKVWVWIAVVFIVICVTEYIHRNLNIVQREYTGAAYRKLNGKPVGLCSVLLDVFSFHLGNAVAHVPKTFGGKSMLLIYLWYAMIMTTGYKSFLASVLAIDAGAPRITNDEQIIRYNLTVGGSYDNYEILKDQASESEHSKILMNRFVINNNDTETLNRLKHDRNYAFLTRSSYLNYEKKKSLSNNDWVTFDTVNDCVLGYPTVIIFNNKSALREPINYVIRCLTEAGILGYWASDGEDIDNKIMIVRAQTYPKKRLTHKLRFILSVYCHCIVICSAVFFIELLIPKLLFSVR